MAVVCLQSSIAMPQWGGRGRNGGWGGGYGGNGGGGGGWGGGNYDNFILRTRRLIERKPPRVKISIPLRSQIFFRRLSF